MKSTEEWLLEWEGYRPFIYKCSQNVWTVGVGRVVEEGKGPGLSRDEAMYLLRNDIERVTGELQSRFDWFDALSEDRKTAIVSMAFQLGLGGLLKFKNALKSLEEGDFAAAADHFLDSLWAAQTPNRAKQVVDLLRGN